MLRYIVLSMAIFSATEAILKIQLPSFGKEQHYLMESTYPVHIVNRYAVPTPVPVPVRIQPIIKTVRQPVYIHQAPVAVPVPVAVHAPAPYIKAASFPIAPVPDCGGDCGGVAIGGGYGGGYGAGYGAGY